MRYITAIFLVISWLLPTTVNSYTPPPWWARIVAGYTGTTPLETCHKVVDGFQPPVVTGQGCSNKPKTCYFGDQICPDGRPYPTEECICPGDITRSKLAKWTCMDLKCPDAVSFTPAPSFNPSSAPTETPTSSTCSICGNVKADIDNDNIGDIGVQGAPIILFDKVTGAVAQTTLTDVNGDYCFDVPLVSSSFFIRETNVFQYPLDVSDIDGGDLNLIENVLCNSIGNNFVDEPTCSICGNVKADLDGDALGDIGVPLSQVEQIDASGVVVASTLTDTNGDYCFDIVPGPYSIRQTNVPQYPGDVSDTDGANDNIISVPDGDCTSTGNDFVDEGSILCSICGNVKADLNNDDIGDLDIEDSTIELLDLASNVLTSTVTDIDGNYCVDAPFGSYILRQTNVQDYPNDVSDIDGNNDSTIQVTIDGATCNSIGNDFVDEV